MALGILQEVIRQNESYMIMESLSISWWRSRVKHGLRERNERIKKGEFTL
jgi:hypothetical protein